MQQRGKVVSVTPSDCQVLLNQVLAGARNEKGASAIKKDWLLIECAMGSERRIVSCDTTAYSELCHASQTVSALNAVVWVNPDADETSAINWLKAGANEVDQYRIRDKRT